MPCRWRRGAEIVKSVIRESGILIYFFSKVIDKINTKIEDNEEESFSTEELKEFLDVQKRYNLAYKEALGKDTPKEIEEYIELKEKAIIAGESPDWTKRFLRKVRL